MKVQLYKKTKQTNLEMETTSPESITTTETAYETTRTTSSHKSTTDATSITKSLVVETATKQSNATIENINGDFFTNKTYLTLLN